MHVNKKYIIPVVALTVLIALLIVINTMKDHVPFETNMEHIHEHKNEVRSYVDTQLTYEIIETPNNTYGYNIKTNGRILIHQPNIPALPGHEGFKTEEFAITVAELVISKIRQSNFPPSVSVYELDSLGVLVD
jgi:hypothetical protein